MLVGRHVLAAGGLGQARPVVPRVVDRPRAHEDQAPVAPPAARQVGEHAQVALELAARVGGVAVSGAYGAVHHDIDVVRGEVAGDPLVVEQLELGVRRRQHVPARRQVFDQVATDKAGAAGDEDGRGSRRPRRGDRPQAQPPGAGGNGEERRDSRRRAGGGRSAAAPTRRNTAYCERTSTSR